MKKQAIFMAATGQHVGKTTICLGLVHGLKKRLKNVGFIKPVGQRGVKIEDSLHVDKDVALFKRHFKLSHSFIDMSEKNKIRIKGNTFFISKNCLYIPIIKYANNPRKI